MKELEKNVMCVLLQRLLDKNLITPKIFDNAGERILDTFDSAEFFCYAKDTAEGIHFAVCANLPPQSVALEEPQYTPYCDSSKACLEPESFAQTIKKTPSAVSGDRKEESHGYTQNPC